MLKIVVRLAVVLAVVGSAGATAWWWWQYRLEKTATGTVSVGDLLTGVTVSGTIRDKEKTAVSAEVVAAVADIPVTEGQVVEPGTVLIRLDDRMIAAECDKSQAQVELAEDSLAELKAGPRKEQVVQARQAVVQAQCELSYALSDQKRTAELLRRGGATQSEADLANKKVAVCQSSLKSAQAALDLLEAGARPEELARAQAEVDLAKSDLARCQALRDKYTLRAPHHSVVTALYVHVGEVVSPGEILLHLNNTQHTEIRAEVQETQLSGVQVGHMAQVLADAYPHHPLEAQVERILPRVDPQSGTVTVLLRLLKPTSLALMDGMAVDIALIRQARHDVVRVPADAVQSDGRLAVVWLRKGDRFVRRPIQVGVSDGQWMEVKSGLSPGDVVRVR